MARPKVSVIVSAKNAQNTIKKCIDSISRLNYGNFELVVVNDGSTDNTAKILEAYNNIKLITTEGIGPSKARNIAMEQVSGEFIAFTDADCIVDSEWINEMLKGFTAESIAGVGGSQNSPEDESEFGKKVQDFLSVFGFISDYMKSGQTPKAARHNPSCNVMYRKSILLELGGFLEGLWPGEDVELDYRIRKKGYKLMFNPKAIVLHYRTGNFKGFCRMMFNYGTAQGQLVRKYGFFRVIHFVPVIILIFLSAFLHSPLPSLIFFASGVILLIIKLAAARKSFIAVLKLFISGMLNWNLGFFLGLLSKKI